MTFRYRTLHQPPLAFATTLIFVFTILLPQISYAVSVQSSRLPHPFQFTENKGQWDSAVVYKCEVRCDGFTWFLERDGVTLVTSVIDSSSLVGATPPPLGVREPPVSVNDSRFDPNGRIQYPRLKSHALKFKFVASCRCEERSEGSSAVGGKPQRSDEAIYSFKDSMIQEEITFGEPFGIASHVPTFIPRKDKSRYQTQARRPAPPQQKRNGLKLKANDHGTTIIFSGMIRRSGHRIVATLPAWYIMMSGKASMLNGMRAKVISNSISWCIPVPTRNKS